MLVVDTNILIRYLTQDEPDHARRALAFLRRLESGETQGMIPEGVIVESVQVLSSRNSYNVARAEIRQRLGDVLGLAGVRTPLKETYLRALEIYVDVPQLSFVDALCVAYAERDEPSTVVSFDREFRRARSVKWEQP